MRLKSVSLIAATLVLAVPVTSKAASSQAPQSTPIRKYFEGADRIQVAVTAHVRFARAQGTVFYSYTLASSQASQQPVLNFAIKHDAPVTLISAAPGWEGGTISSSAFWSWDVVVDSALVRPGGSATGFQFSSQGLPTIQSFHAQGLAPMPKVPDEVEGLPEDQVAQYKEALDYFANSVKGETIGPSSTRLSESVPSLMAYLKQEQERVAESSHSVKSRGFLNRLGVKVRSAEKSFSTGNAQATSGLLRAYRNELLAQAGKRIDAEMASMLATIADVIASKL